MHNNKRKIISTMLFLSLGFLCLILGSIGIVLPLLPTVPFYLVTVFCFARSSEKLYDWFTHTSMYKKHLESFVQKKGMTLRTKFTITGSASFLMGIGFLMMKSVPVGRILLAIVWICHIIYFFFVVKTIKETEDDIFPEKQNKKAPVFHAPLSGAMKYRYFSFHLL